MTKLNFKTFSRISPALQTQPPGTINANSNEATTGRKRRKVADETSTQEHKMEEESTTIANNMSEQLIQTSMASTSSTIVEVKSEEQPKVKRKRGRPKKSGVDEPMLDATPTGTATKSTAKFNWFVCCFFFNFIIKIQVHSIPLDRRRPTKSI